MKLGIIFSGADHRHCLIPRFLRWTEEATIPVWGYASTGPLFGDLLSALLGVPPERLKYIRKRKKLRYLTQLQMPLLFCQKDLLSNQTVYFGNLPKECFAHYPAEYINGYSLKKLLKIAKHRKPYCYRGRIYSNCYLKCQDFLMGMWLSGCDICLFVRFVRPNVRKEPEFVRLSANSAQITIAIDPDGDLQGEWERFWERNRLTLYEFLYF